LERTDPFNFLKTETIKAEFEDFFKEFDNKELASMFLMSDDPEVNLFDKFLKSLEASLMDD
jgi:hypothetical protein